MYLCKHLSICHRPRDLPQGNNNADTWPSNICCEKYCVSGRKLHGCHLADLLSRTRRTYKIGVESCRGIYDRFLIVNQVCRDGVASMEWRGRPCVMAWFRVRRRTTSNEDYGMMALGTSRCLRCCHCHLICVLKSLLALCTAVRDATRPCRGRVCPLSCDLVPDNVILEPTR